MLTSQALPHSISEPSFRQHNESLASSTPISDLALVTLALGGDNKAKRQLIDQCLPMIYSVVRRMGIAHQEVNDLSHDVIVKLLRSLAQFKGESKLSTWVFTLTRRMVIDHFRASSHREQAVDWSDPETEQKHMSSVHVDSPEQQRDADKMTTLLTNFEEPMRSIMLRFYLADESVNEISEALDLPSGTIKTHLFRGRALLRSQLEIS